MILFNKFDANSNFVRVVVSLIFFVVIGISMAIISYIEYREIKSEIFNKIENQNISMSKEYNLILNTLNENILFNLQEFLNSNDIKKALKDRNRELLYSLSKDYFLRLQKDNKYIKIFTFRDENRVSFLRVHKPNRYGDKLDKNRFIISHTFETKKVQYGFEVGKFGIAYRVSIPIFDNIDFLGVLEIGIEPEYILSKLKIINDIEFLLAIKSKKLDIYELEFQNSKIYGEYTLLSGSNFIKNNLYKMNEYGNIKDDHKNYIVNDSIKLKSFRDEISGVVFIAHDFTYVSNRLHSIMLNNLVVAMFLLIFIIGMFHTLLNYLLNETYKTKDELMLLNDTLQDKIEDATTDLKEYNKAITDSYIVSKTDINGIITYVNKAFCDATGYSKEELIGKNHNIVRDPLVSAEVFKGLWKKILNKEIVKTQSQNITKNGKRIYLNSTIIPILNSNGDIKEFIALRFDVTNEVETRVKLEKSLDDIVKKDKLIIYNAKLAQMGELLSMIAHQWRQPLAAISSTSLDLKFKIDLDRFEEDYFLKKLDKISVYSDGLSSTINDFRSFYRTDNVKSNIILNEIVNTSLDIIGTSIRNKNINIDIDFQATHKVDTYANELKQVLLNIFKNSEDALVLNKTLNPFIKIKTFDSEKYSFLEVSDNAGGIPIDILDKIFDPYFSTKSKKDGTGLGLYMSKIMVEEHCNGELLVDNIENGTKFTIKILI